jgi:hypothetical protein
MRVGATAVVPGRGTWIRSKRRAASREIATPVVPIPTAGLEPDLPFACDRGHFDTLLVIPL